jgi:putative YphP/YqiW family bacilliredoxin
MYPEEMVKPMQAELTAGFQDLHSAEAVDNAIKAEGTHWL